MTIENSYGFRSAQSAWENATPFDDDCICLDDPFFICPECGQDGNKEMDCTMPLCEGTMQEVSDDARREDFPKVGCPQHDKYTDADAADDAREHDYEARMGY